MGNQIRKRTTEELLFVEFPKACNNFEIVSVEIPAEFKFKGEWGSFENQWNQMQRNRTKDVPFREQSCLEETMGSIN